MKKKYDLFLSYSSNDREAVVAPLYNELYYSGFRPWFDIKEILWGDSIIESIQDSISNVKFVLVFISKTYLEKPWPLKELRTALALQISGGPTILPVLLGLTGNELQNYAPFLSEIKHITVNEYNSEEKLDKSDFDLIIKELIRAKHKLKPIKEIERSQVCDIENPIEICTFNSEYLIYSIMTIHESLEINRRYSNSKLPIEKEESVDLNNLIYQLFKDSEISETNEISCFSNNAIYSPEHLIALKSGNILLVHRAHIHNTPKLEIQDYIITNAPKNPTCGALSDIGTEVFLGYKDGSLYIWNKKGVLLKDIQSAIKCIDMSSESIVVAGAENGEIGIWSRRPYKFIKYISTNNPIYSIAVNKFRSAYRKNDDNRNGIFTTGHQNGIINFWSFYGDSISSYRVAQEPIIAVCFFPFELEYLGLATVNKLIIINVITGETIMSLSHEDGNIRRLHIGNKNPHSPRLSDISVYATIGCDNGKVFSWELLI